RGCFRFPWATGPAALLSEAGLNSATIRANTTPTTSMATPERAPPAMSNLGDEPPGRGPGRLGCFFRLGGPSGSPEGRGGKRRGSGWRFWFPWSAGSLSGGSTNSTGTSSSSAGGGGGGTGTSNICWHLEQRTFFPARSSGSLNAALQEGQLVGIGMAAAVLPQQQKRSLLAGAEKKR